MFEQASIDSPGLLKRPWAISISLLGQAAILSAVALVSLLHTNALPAGFSFTRVVAPGRSPAPPPASRGAKAPATAARATEAKAFHAPSVIPAHISMGVIDAPTPADSGVAVNEVWGSVGPGGGGGLAWIDVPHPAPPPVAVKPAAQEPKPPAPAPKRIAVSTGVQAARLIRQVNPSYPALARQARVSGTVRLTAIIGRDGAIERLQLISGHPLLASAALEAVRQWSYRPTLLNNEPVEVITQIDVNFTLGQEH